MDQSDSEFQEKWSIKLENMKNKMFREEGIKVIKK